MIFSRFIGLSLLAQTALASSVFALDSTALPVGGNTVSGQAAITQSGSRMDIHQTTDRSIIEWQGFDVGRNAHVNFQQPHGNAAILNRVIAGDASQIHGKLTANGQVYLVNPNGVIFSNSSQVNVGGLVASTHAISNEDFNNGVDRFTRNGATGTVENHGNITRARVAMSY